MSRQCVNLPDSFCYVCGEYTIKSHRQSVTPLVKKAYELYFGCKLTDQGKKCAPNICCTNCASRLRGWLKNKRTRFTAIRCSHDVEGDNQSCQRLLFLYDPN
jgi:hypothetical protein